MEETCDELSDLFLRPLELADIDDFMEWASDEKVTRFCTFEPYSSKEQGIKYIMEVTMTHPWLKAICFHNKVIGCISVTKNSGADGCRGEIGYELASKYWGRGYELASKYWGRGIATEAVKLVVNTIFEEWPWLERLEALVDVQNVGSQRVLEKAGFTREGVLRKYYILKGKTSDMVLFSILSTDRHLP